MDGIFTLFTLILVFFIIKIFILRQKYKENFENKSSSSNKSNAAKSESKKSSITPKSNKNDSDNSTVDDNQSVDESTENLSETMIEPMSYSRPEENENVYDEISNVLYGLGHLDEVYKENTPIYGTFDDSDVNGPIPLIPMIPKPSAPSSINIPGIGNIDILGPLFNILFQIIDATNKVLEITNQVYAIINKAIFYATCSWNLFINFFLVPCAFWYILDVFGRILYYPFGGIIFPILGMTDFVNQYFWGMLYLFDEVFYDMSGFHFAHFPDAIMKACYSCPVGKASTPESGITDAFTTLKDILSKHQNEIMFVVFLFFVYLVNIVRE